MKHISASLGRLQSDVDVFLLQEDAFRDGRSIADLEVFREWSHVYGQMHQPFELGPYYDFVHAGQTILSRYPLEFSEVLPLPSLSRSPLGDGHRMERVAVYARLRRCDGMSVGLYNVHLENLTGPSGRREQIECVLEAVEKHGDDHVIIGGDFNTYLGPFETSLRVLRSRGYDRGRSFGLDHIFTSSSIGARRDQRLPEGHAGSDHRPTSIARLRFSR